MKKLLVILSLLVGTQASAGILLEPYAGYHLGKGKMSGTPDDDVTGVGFGGRLGWTLPLVFIAFDYSTAGVDVEPDGGTKDDADLTNMGVVVGASLPVLRLWAGYNFASELKFDAGKYEGAGMKAGAGFKLPVLPISFNLEYIMNEFDEYEGSSIPDKYKVNTLFVSVSAPFTF